MINAIVQDRFIDAINEARAIDRKIANGFKSIEDMERDTPLLGLPVTVKESIAVKGMVNQGGRVCNEKQISKYDADCIKRIKHRGGIIILVSNTPELCMCWETYNNVTGLTKNPYDLRRTPGGSSGGESALLGSGASLISISSDVAGSARLPAMFTGIFGHKPTPYVISPYGHVPQSDSPKWGDFFTIAPMARYASDLPLLLKCLSDSTGPKLSLDLNVPIDSINFYFMNNDGPSGTIRPLQRDVKKAIDDVAAYFNAQKVKLNRLKWAFEISTSAMLQMKGVGTIYGKQIDGEPKTSIGTETIK